MYKSEDIEKWASGLKRIYEESTAAGVKVEFKRIPMGFVVIFYRPKWEEGQGLVDSEDMEEAGGQKSKGKTTQKILDLIRENPHITRKELAGLVGLSEEGVKFNLNKLKKEKFLKRIGPDKGGHWEVN